MIGKTICIVQARVNSLRLPNKVLMDLNGASVLERVVYRTSKARMYYDELVVATGAIDDNNIIEDLCKYNGWKCMRGSEDDVLDRFYVCAEIEQAEHIVRICADDPFTDPTIIASAIGVYFSSKADYVSTETVYPANYPIGLHVEVFSKKVLDKAWKETILMEDREHVTSYIWKNPEKFKLVGVEWAGGDYSHIRLTVDTMEDYRRARRLYDSFGNADFHWTDVIWYVERSHNGLLY